MRNGNGLNWLVILTSCFVLVCLGYVSLCNTMSQRVNDPDTEEYWQIRTLGLKFRSPEQEARDAVNEGDFQVFDLENPPADSPEPPRRSNQRIRTATFGTSAAATSTVNRQRAMNEFDQAQIRFADRYDRELARSMNPGR